jgi:hypothetical protein
MVEYGAKLVKPSVVSVSILLLALAYCLSISIWFISDDIMHGPEYNNCLVVLSRPFEIISKPPLSINSLS